MNKFSRILKSRIFIVCLVLFIIISIGASILAYKKIRTVKLSCDSPTIKGNISKDVKVYHIPKCQHYNKTIVDKSKGERMFCTEEEAKKAGWRKCQETK